MSYIQIYSHISIRLAVYTENIVLEANTLPFIHSSPFSHACGTGAMNSTHGPPNLLRSDAYDTGKGLLTSLMTVLVSKGIERTTVI
jgi:hypothetical protein